MPKSTLKEMRRGSAYHDGDDLPVGEVGEIVVRSEAMCMECWELPEETEASVRQGWRYTGDFGKFDHEGNV